MLGGVISLLVELGRELDLVLTPGSVKEARQASGEVGQQSDHPALTSRQGLSLTAD